MRDLLRRHPVISAIFIGCTLLGAGHGYSLLSDDCSAPRRILAGTIGGAGVGLLITATKLID